MSIRYYSPSDDFGRLFNLVTDILTHRLEGHVYFSKRRRITRQAMALVLREGRRHVRGAVPGRSMPCEEDPLA